MSMLTRDEYTRAMGVARGVARPGEFNAVKRNEDVDDDNLGIQLGSLYRHTPRKLDAFLERVDNPEERALLGRTAEILGLLSEYQLDPYEVDHLFHVLADLSPHAELDDLREALAKRAKAYVRALDAAERRAGKDDNLYRVYRDEIDELVVGGRDPGEWTRPASPYTDAWVASQPDAPPREKVTSDTLTAKVAHVLATDTSTSVTSILETLGLEKTIKNMDKVRAIRRRLQGRNRTGGTEHGGTVPVAVPTETEQNTRTPLPL